MQRLAGARAIEVLAHERAYGAGIEERLAAHRGAAGLDEVAVDGALEHVAGGAGADRLEQVLLVVVHREHEHADLGLAVRDLTRGLQSRLARHRDVEDRQMDVLGECPLDGLVAVGRLGDDLEVGLGVEHHAQSAQDDRMVVGDEDAGLQRGRHAILGSKGIGELDLGAAGRRFGDGELGSDEHGAFAHAADAVGGPEGARWESAAVIANGQDDVARSRSRWSSHLGGVGVPGDVRERLLRDAVDDQLLFLRQR